MNLFNKPKQYSVEVHNHVTGKMEPEITAREVISTSLKEAVLFAGFELDENEFDLIPKGNVLHVYPKGQAPGKKTESNDEFWARNTW